MSSIVFENVSTSYHQNIALKNISLTFQPNKTTAVIGPSGSGKAAIFKKLRHDFCEDVAFWEILTADFDGLAVEGISEKQCNEKKAEICRFDTTGVQNFSLGLS